MNNEIPPVVKQDTEACSIQPRGWTTNELSRLPTSSLMTSLLCEEELMRNRQCIT